MKNKFSTPLLVVLLSTLALFSCDKEEDQATLSLLYLVESKTCWDGFTNNYIINVGKGETADTTVNIGLGLYLNGKMDIEPVSVDIEIVSDSLQKAIDLGQIPANSAQYGIYKNARLLPSSYYQLDSKISLAAGEDLTQIPLKLDKVKMFDDNFIKKGGIFILPIRITNATKYKINPVVSFAMLIFTTGNGLFDDTKPDPTDPPEIEGWNLVWSDEFNYTGQPNPAVWTSESGFQRNQELQWYQASNAACANGVLTIVGKKERTLNPNYQAGSNDWKLNREYGEYTSTSLVTGGKKEFQYGQFIIRAKIPTAKGAWPAIWTLGKDMEWPSSGEIDILEYYLLNGQPHILANTAWGTDTRWSAKWNSASKPYSYFTAKDSDWASKFHIWRMDWDENAIRIYVDDELLNETLLSGTINGSWGQYRNPFQQPHYILLNLALGGNGGTPDDSAFPLKYEVDYVRVYQKAN